MQSSPLWYKSAVFYELHVRAFKDSNADGIGDLQGVIQKLDYLKELGISCIWLLPIFPSPLRDDGYDVADYYSIHPDYGTLDDFTALIKQAHARGIRVITDLVLNHTSDQHPWFQEARANPDSPFHDYYVWSDDPHKYEQARIIFTDTEKSNWAWEDLAEKYYWHRFFSHQPDLNFDNLAVQQEMLKIMDFWLDLGIDGFRVDAIPYLFEREGTNCENLPETHTFLKEARAHVQHNYPDTILLSEANQWPQDVRPYLGDGDEMHMAFHFPLMPRIFMALRQQSRTAIQHILARTPSIPENTQWCLFLRNHDELTLEMVTEEERQWMWQQYAPEERMRLNLGIRRRLAPLLDNNLQQILLSFSILLTLPGSPILYYGDEIGMGDNIMLKDRDGVRTPMQWSSDPSAGFSELTPNNFYSPLISQAPYTPAQVNVTDQGHQASSLLTRLQHMLAIRQANQDLSMGDFAFIDSDLPESILAYSRTHQGQSFLIVHNLSDVAIDINLPFQSSHPPLDLLSGKAKGTISGQNLKLHLSAHQYLWLKLNS